MKENPKEKTCPFPAEGCYYKGPGNTCVRGEEKCLHQARENPGIWEKPRRNCDVGTQDEIVGRFVDYCASQKLCPAWESCRICLVKWMLDTYKEDGQ